MKKSLLEEIPSKSQDCFFPKGLIIIIINYHYSRKSHDRLDMLARNRLANVSFLVCSLGELVVLAILAGILEGVINDDPDSNTKALSIVCAYSAGVWSESLLFIVWPRLTKNQQSYALPHGCCSSNTALVISFLLTRPILPLGKSTIGRYRFYDEPLTLL